MHMGLSDGSRLGALAQAIFYLVGIPIFLDKTNITHSHNQFQNEDWASSPENLSQSDNDRLCYDSIGCFKIRYPERKGYDLVPTPLEEIMPTVCLYTKANLLACQVVEAEVASATALPLSNGTAYWIAHGYIENGQRPWIKSLVNELLQDDSTTNVFVIDWSGGSKPPYNQAVENVEMIAAFCANLMATMEENGPKVNETHFIGHSLGAHLGGFLGTWLQEQRNLTLGRISGLDPAQLYFQGLPTDARLDPSDAHFVDVIHTDAKPFLNGGEMVAKPSPNIRPLSGLGIQDPIGHADFFPNGGKDQPGCKDGVYQAILQEEGSVTNGLRRFLGCDHIRSYEYFTESIRSDCQFMAFSCDSWEDFAESTCTASHYNRMGFHASKPSSSENAESGNSSNIYYSITGSRSPFCREHYRVTIHLADESKYRSTSELHLVLVNDTSGVSTVLNLGTIDFMGKGLVRKYTVSGVNVGSPNKLILRPSSSNPLRWLMTRMATPAQPDVVVKNITLSHLESLLPEHTFCPVDGKNSFSATDQNPSINFAKNLDQC